MPGTVAGMTTTAHSATTVETSTRSKGATSAGERWATCSKAAHESVSKHTHRVDRGKENTLCGASAPRADVWRANSTKPRCPTCLERTEASVR